jgi:hypothetical protein
MTLPFECSRYILHSDDSLYLGVEATSDSCSAKVSFEYASSQGREEERAPNLTDAL